MAVGASKALVRRLHEIWNTGDVARLEDVYAADFVAHFPPSSELPERRGLDGVRRGIARIRTAFPDWREEVEDLVGEGDRVVSRYTSTGTHRGPFWARLQQPGAVLDRPGGVTPPTLELLYEISMDVEAQDVGPTPSTCGSRSAPTTAT